MKLKQFQKTNLGQRDLIICVCLQQELFLSEVSNKETIEATEANNDTYCLWPWY